MTPLLVADLFCGAGGSSTGAKRALARHGLCMDLVAVNHWNIAVETHARNHPEARHVCVDLFRTRPIDVVPGGRLDLLMASPTCTFFSRARGGAPISHDQKYGRMTPTQVLRWVTDLDVKVMLVENVPEFVEWGPVCRETMRPNKSKRGMYFRAWTRRLERAGYRVDWRVLNAADFGGATTRSRFFLIGRKDGAPIRWPEPTHAKGGGSADLFAPPVKPWRGAREVIDWSIAGKSIFRRKRPLSPKTLARIYAGAKKFRWPEPFLVILRNHMDGQSVEEPIPTVCAGGTHIGLAQPFMLPQRSDCEPTRTTDAPLSTVTTVARMAVIEPVVVRTDMHKSNAACVRGAGEPLATITTGGGFAVAEPFVVGNRAHNTAKGPSEPIPGMTTSTGGGVALVEPVVLPQGGGGRARPVSQPVATIATDGAHALVAPYYGTGVAAPVSRPLPTVTTKDRFGLVVPTTHAGGHDRAHALEDPLPCVTGAHRGELAFIAAAFGERPGQAPRVHDVAEPAPTICAEGRVQLVEGRADPAYDILFRMLTPRELARAMGFSDAESEYEFAGNKTEITRQIGNAVSVEQAEALVGAIFGGTAA